MATFPSHADRGENEGPVPACQRSDVRLAFTIDLSVID